MLFALVEKLSDEYWKDLANCRRYFDKFAAEAGFDPLDVNRWYSLNLNEVLAKQVPYHSNDVFNCAKIT